MNAGQKKLVVIVSVTAALSALAVFLYLFMGRETKEERVSSQQKDNIVCLLYTSPSPRDPKTSRMPSSA